MEDGILHQRLQKQRGQQAVEGLRFDMRLDGKALAEANFFDGQEALQQLELLTQGYERSFAEAQGQAQEFREQNAHLLRFRGVDAGQGADGIETVEKEVRVDLGFQGFQLRITREDAGLQDARLGGARFFHGQDHVMRSHREDVKQESRAKK